MARALGCRLDTVPIAGAQAAVGEALAPLFAGTRARDHRGKHPVAACAGLLLMALSNKFGEMLLTTGNKSEVAVGYCTIYGDMNGGYNPIKDLYKTRVFPTCRWRNENHRAWMKGPAGEVIPPRVIDKPPVGRAAPRPEATKTACRPIRCWTPSSRGWWTAKMSVADLVAQGFDRATVKKVEHLLYLSEYKRFQSAPGTRLTHPRLLARPPLSHRQPLAGRGVGPAPRRIAPRHRRNAPRRRPGPRRPYATPQMPLQPATADVVRPSRLAAIVVQHPDRRPTCAA